MTGDFADTSLIPSEAQRVASSKDFLCKEDTVPERSHAWLLLYLDEAPGPRTEAQTHRGTQVSPLSFLVAWREMVKVRSDVPT